MIGFSMRKFRFYSLQTSKPDLASVHILSINILFKIFWNSVEFTKNIIDFWEEGLHGFSHNTILPQKVFCLLPLFWYINN